MTFMMTGCRTTQHRRARGAGVCWWDASTRPWALRGELVMTNPSYLLPDVFHRTVWVLQGDGRTVAILSGEKPAKVLATVPCGGVNPVHLAQPRPELVMVANYASGSVAAFHLDERGLPAGPPSITRLEGSPGPVADQQRGPHPHQVLPDPNGFTLWVPDKGTDSIHQLALAPEPVIVARHQMPPGSGPRHGVRRGNMLHVVEELSATLASHRVDGDRLTTLRRVGTRGNITSSEDGGTGAGISLLPGCRSIVVSNRGDDTLAFFRFDGDELPVLVDVVASGVRGPRFIALEPVTGTLLVAGELSDEVALFDVSSGFPSGRPQIVAHTGSPTCVVPLGGELSA